MVKKMIIRTAKVVEYEKVKTFYYEIIDLMEDMEYKPGWEKGIYPTDEYMKESIERQQLYVGTIDGEIVSAMAVNQSFNEEYKKVKWSVDAKVEEINVIHILCVHPKVAHEGLAKEMVGWVIDFTRNNHQKAVRLDVLSGNVPAEKLYPSIGFKYITTERMYYEDTDWMDFLLFEYPIEA